MAKDEEYMNAFNARDPVAWAATLNYPHLRIARGELSGSETEEEFAKQMDFEQPMPLGSGTTLGPYSVTAKIGEGGMGDTPGRPTRLSAWVFPLKTSEATFDLDQFVQNDDVPLLGVDADGTRLAADEF